MPLKELFKRFDKDTIVIVYDLGVSQEEPLYSGAIGNAPWKIVDKPIVYGLKLGEDYCGCSLQVTEEGSPFIVITVKDVEKNN